MKVPVKVLVDVDDKSFEVEVGTPTTSALIVKELGVEKGSGTPKATKVGNLSPEQIVKIAEMKRTDSYAKTVIAAVKEVAALASVWASQSILRSRKSSSRTSIKGCTRRL